MEDATVFRLAPHLFELQSAVSYNILLKVQVYIVIDCAMVRAMPSFGNPTIPVAINPSSVVSSVLPSGSIGRASASAAP
jgi:hypothetical protein